MGRIIVVAAMLALAGCDLQGRQLWDTCASRTENADLRISACTTLIDGANETRPNTAIALADRGLAYEAKQDYRRAMVDYQRALRINPRLTFALYGRAYIYSRSQDYDRAVADYSAIITQNPSDDNALSDRGFIYEHDLNDYDRAVADYDQAATLAPENGDYQNQRCWARAVAGRDLDVARSACDEGLRLKPEDGEIWDSRGMVDLKQSRFQDAWNDYNTATQKGAARASYFYGRGIAALRLGHTEDSQADIAHAQTLDPAIAQQYVSYGETPARETAAETQPATP